MSLGKFILHVEATIQCWQLPQCRPKIWIISDWTMSNARCCANIMDSVIFFCNSNSLKTYIIPNKSVATPLL